MPRVALVDVAEVRDLADAVVAAFTADWGPRLDGAEIAHIGATALPFGHTKGDVDVNVRVVADRFAAAVESLGRELPAAQPENWTPTFASFASPRYALPLGVQVTVVGSADDFLLALRDLLRSDSDLLRRYDELKVVSAGGGADAYWHAKDEFLRRLI